MQSGVGAVIAVVVYEMGYGIVHAKNTVSIIIMCAAFAATCIFGVNVVLVVIACAPAWCNQDIAGEEEGVVIYIKLF